jgi:hypothetical protein
MVSAARRDRLSLTRIRALTAPRLDGLRRDRPHATRSVHFDRFALLGTDHFSRT